MSFSINFDNKTAIFFKSGSQSFEVGIVIPVGRSGLMDVTVNGAPARLLFDTGRLGDVVLSHSMWERSKLSQNTKVEIKKSVDAFGHSEMISYTKSDVKIGTFSNYIKVGEFPSEIYCGGCDGMVGLSFFDGYSIIYD